MTLNAKNAHKNRPPSNALALALARPASQLSIKQLPLTLGDKEADNAIQTLQPPKNPYPPLVCGMMHSKTRQAFSVKQCQKGKTKGKSIGQAFGIHPKTALQVRICQSMIGIGFHPLNNCQIPTQKNGVLMSHQHTALSQSFALLDNAASLPSAASHHYRHCLGVLFAKTALYHGCQMGKTFAHRLLWRFVKLPAKPICQLSHCLRFVLKQGVAVPCRYYPLAPTPPNLPNSQSQNQNQTVCGNRPQASHLPLPLIRTARQFKPARLPLPFACQQTSAIHPPSQQAYLMHHTITAHLVSHQGTIALNPLSFHIKTDIASFCFSGQIEIGSHDFAAIKDRLITANGQEPLLRIVIDDKNALDKSLTASTATAFAFLCEEISHNQSFAKNSITLAGRSISAHLSKDYAGACPIDPVDLYASQIVAAQLANLSIAAQFALADYLVPKGHYSTHGKTPIGVLNDIAKACGGFLYSHPDKPIISLLPRYKVPSWQINNTAPDVLLTKDCIKTLSTTSIKKPLYNTVTLIGQTQGGIVYRQDLGQDKDAPVSDNPLYVEQANMIQAGAAILSDSGNKTKFVLSLPLSAKHRLNLAQLGDIWQIGADGQKAVVQGLSVSVTVNDGVVSVWQTVELLGEGVN